MTTLDLDAAERLLRPDEATALAAWRTLVEADAEQVQRVTERSLGGDYYRPIAHHFAPNPRPSPELAILEALARPEDTWRDIGAGGGRFAIPLARLVRRVHAVEPSEAQREILRQAMAREPGDIVIDERRWPVEDETSVEPVDVSLSVHAVYDTRDLLAYLDAMERTTLRLCVVVLADHARGWYWRGIFEAVHGERQAVLPSLTEFVAVMAARGRRFDVQTVEAEPREPISLDAALEMGRRFLWLAEGSEKDEMLRRLVLEHFGRQDGLVDAPPTRRYLGIVSWEPGASV